MGLMGLGLGTSGVGLAWDFYVHEIARDVGRGITALGFLLSLVSVRFRGQRPVDPA